LRLPAFRYHPNPVATGSVLEPDVRCVCCAEGPRAVHVGPIYAVEDYEEQIYPWCIADGSAREKLDVFVADEEGIGSRPRWDDVPEEVAYRTPKFSGWQQELWWTPCGDGGAYLGPAGRRELEAVGSAAFKCQRRFADSRSPASSTGWRAGRRL